MYFHCDHCGHEARFGPSRTPAGIACPVCGIGTMVSGQARYGFTVERGALAACRMPEVRYEIKASGDPEPYESFNYFAGHGGERYRQFIDEKIAQQDAVDSDYEDGDQMVG